MGAEEEEERVEAAHFCGTPVAERNADDVVHLPIVDLDSLSNVERVVADTD